MAIKKRSFAVIGLGRFGSKIARELVGFGNHVIGIDVDERLVAPIADTLTEAVIADARDEHALIEAGLAHYDAAIVAIGSSLEASVLCHMNLHNIGIKQITVKAFNDQHSRILTALGATDIVMPEQDAGEHIAQRLHNPLIHNYMEVCPGSYVALVEVQPKQFGKSPQMLNIEQRFEASCIGVMHDGRYFSPNQDDALILAAGDRMLIQGSRAAIRNFADAG